MNIQNKKSNFKKNLFNLLPFLGFIFSLLLSNSFSSRTRQGQLDHLSYSLIDYNKVTNYDDYDSPIINVKTKSQFDLEKNRKSQDYNELFYQFHYSLIVNGCRTLIDNDLSLEVSDQFLNFKATLLPTYSVRETNSSDKDEVYMIDYAQYYAYFARPVHDFRNQTPQGFVYISDTLADKLVEKHGIEGPTKLDRYNQLLSNSEYSVLPLYSSVFNEEVNITITNIVHSNIEEGQGKRMLALYDDFALIWLVESVSKKLEYSFEIDLKNNPYGNKKAINFLNSYGFTYENSDFLIKTKLDNEYQVNEKTTLLLNKILQNNTSALYTTLFIINIFIMGIFLILFFKISIKRNITINRKFQLYLLLSLFFLYGIIVSFIYNHPLNGLTAILYVLFFIVFNRIIYSKRSKIQYRYEAIYEIDI
ncbi:MAG: hypothetical protein ACOX28_03440 [Bacilli bacterium]|jgi:hypothetical protein